jgi:hypothetical protein
MVLCKNGHTNPDGATVCSVCGVAIGIVAEPEPGLTQPDSTPTSTLPVEHEPATQAKPRSRIFICYRHEGDGADVAGRLYDNLVYRFGREHVFRDIVNLDPGTEYAKTIDDALDTACATVVVITPDWATVTDDKGRRRLDNPGDFVRLEVGTALQQGELVVPVLVKGASMPSADTLPPDLSALPAKHALTMTDLHWEDGMERLIAAIEPHLPMPAAAGQAGVVEPTGADGEREPERVTTGQKEGLRAILGPAALTVVGAGLLLAGVFITLPEGHGHTLISNDFGGSAPDGGRFTALSPLSIVIGSLVALLLSFWESTRGLAAGLLLGFGIAGCATYVGVWTFASGTSGRWLPSILGGVLLVAAAVWLARTARDPSTATRDALVTVLALAGAILILVGVLVPYSDYKGSSSVVDKGWGTYLLPFVCAASAAVLAAVLFWMGLRALWLGALIAIGVCSCLVFVRFIGVPAMRSDSLRAGAFLGAAGSLLAIVAGALGYARARRARLPQPMG